MSISKNSILLITVVILFFFVGLLFYQNIDKEFIGTDPYMRMVRIDQLTNGHWYDDFIYESNAPFGEKLHWTKPLDILIIGLSLPLKFISKNPMTLAGIMISPLLGGLALLSLYHGVKPLIKERGLILVMMLASFPLYQFFGFGRSDHHSLLLLTFSISLGLIIRMVKEKSILSGCLLGIVLGFGMWVSVEFLAVILILFIALMLQFLWTRSYLNEMLLVSIFLTLSAFLFLLIEQKISDFEIVYDTLSLVYVVAFIAMTVVLSLVYILYQRKPKYHVLYTLLIGALGIIALLLIYPKLIMGPFASVNEEIKTIWLSKVSEVQPLLSADKKDIGMTFIYLGTTLLALVVYFYRLIKGRLSDIHIIILVMMIMLTLLTLYQVRWAGYITLISFIPGGCILESWLGKLYYKPLRLLVIIVFIFIWLVIGMGILSSLEPNDNSVNKELEKVCEIMDSREMTGVMMTFIDFGPEILYRTDLEIIASPYHRNDQGILFVYKTMAKGQEDVIEELIKRHVDYILIAPSSSERHFYLDQSDSLYNLLKSNRQPNYIKELVLSEEISYFKLFKIDWTMIEK